MKKLKIKRKIPTKGQYGRRSVLKGVYPINKTLIKNIAKHHIITIM